MTNEEIDEWLSDLNKELLKKAKKLFFDDKFLIVMSLITMNFILGEIAKRLPDKQVKDLQQKINELESSLAYYRGD